MAARCALATFLGKRYVIPSKNHSRFSSLGRLNYSKQKTTDSNSSDGEQRSEREHKSTEDIEDIKNKILAAALQFVTTYGWSVRAIAAGAESSGFSRVSHGLFRGGGDLVHFFNEMSNEQLEDKLIKSGVENKNIEMKDCIETRLKMIVPYLHYWPQAQSLMLLPANAGKGIENFCNLMDILCYYSGHRSVDMRWYSKRLSLAAVYKSTEMILIRDKSPDFQDTWDFLDRRLNDQSSFELCQEQVGNFGATFEGGLITLRNILGVNRTNK